MPDNKARIHELEKNPARTPQEEAELKNLRSSKAEPEDEAESEEEE